jgi:hypothetical protein
MVLDHSSKRMRQKHPKKFGSIRHREDARYPKLGFLYCSTKGDAKGGMYIELIITRGRCLEYKCCGGLSRKKDPQNLLSMHTHLRESLERIVEGSRESTR